MSKVMTMRFFVESRRALERDRGEQAYVENHIYGARELCFKHLCMKPQDISHQVTLTICCQRWMKL